MKWDIRPAKEMTDYLDGCAVGSAGTPVPEGGGREMKLWRIGPDEEIRRYLDLASGKKAPFDSDPDAPKPPPENTAVDITEYLEAYKKWRGYIGGRGVSYNEIGDFSPLPDTQEKIQAFIDAIVGIPDVCLGDYVSYCVNEVYPERSITLTMGRPLDYLGWGTKKEWTINGNVRDNAGADMKTGGKITINGNARYRVGWLMEGGQITVNGDADEQVGLSMTGGEIRINGSCKGIARHVDGGDIYYKGRVVS